MDAVWYCIADVSYQVFGILEKLGMLPNFFFMACGGCAFLYWMYSQKKYNDEADARGTLK
ncbi:MAG: hypothetical protein IT233_07950 [Bacteroidia bacterium]|nr:hypothetical protein [Bacteroidia bacterium]